jgi:hypothetical protein
VIFITCKDDLPVYFYAKTMQWQHSQAVLNLMIVNGQMQGGYY